MNKIKTIMPYIGASIGTYFMFFVIGFYDFILKYYGNWVLLAIVMVWLMILGGLTSKMKKD